MICGPRQRFTAVPILGGSVNNSVAFVQATLGALYVEVKYWGASAATAPASSAARVSWSGSTSSAAISSPGTAGSGIGSGVHYTSPNGIDLSVTEALGYPVYFWFNPTPLVATLVGYGNPWPMPFPALNIRLVGNAAASPGGDITVNADVWVWYADSTQQHGRGQVADAGVFPFIPMPS